MKVKAAFALASSLLFYVSLSQAQVSDGQVKIGVLTDLSGQNADPAGKGSIVAAEMAVEDFGKTVLGGPIAIVSADHQNKPELGSTIARQWFDQDKVDMIVDLPNSAISLAVQNIAREKNRISLISGASADLATNKQCSPNGAHWTYDSYSVGKILGSALAKPGTTWFFIAADTTGGETLINSARPFIESGGGKIVGQVKHPQNTADMASYLLQAQGSRAQYIVLATSGSDLVNLMKQAREFGITGSKQTMVSLIMFTTDLKAVGLEDGQGLTFGTAFFPESSPETSAWTQRFIQRHGAGPTEIQAGVYSAVSHYLKAVAAAGTDGAERVMAKMRELPVKDILTKGGTLRDDGRMMHEMFLVQAKKPSESSGPWDLTRLLQIIPGSDAFRPLEKSECPLVKK